MITPKEDFIEKTICLMCKRCHRPNRVRERAKIELSNDEFDFEKDKKMAQIIAEEA